MGLKEEFLRRVIFVKYEDMAKKSQKTFQVLCEKFRDAI